MAQLPCLANLNLGVPTAGRGRGKSGRGVARTPAGKMLAIIKSQNMGDMRDMAWYSDAKTRQMFELEGDQFLTREHVSFFLLTLAYRFWEQFYRPQNQGVNFETLVRFHANVYHEVISGAKRWTDRCSDAPEIVDMILRQFSAIAHRMYNNYLNTQGKDVVHIVQTLDAVPLSMALLGTFAEYSGLDSKGIPASAIHQFEIFNERVNAYFIKLAALYVDTLERQEKMERLAALDRQQPRAPRPRPAPAAPEPKSNEEYEANKKKNDEREKLEELERLELKAKQAAEIAKSRAEAHAKAIREEQEREDANAAGSSRSHAWPTQPLSPGSRAKKQAEEQEALLAKARQLEEFRERLAKQVAEKKKQLAEQQRREDERERALRVVNVFQNAAAAPPKDKKK